MDIGILGGTFDPVHLGHINSALAVKETLKLDSLILMPNRMPYYKNEVQTADAHRLNMLKIATSVHPSLVVSDRELVKTTYSYTYDNMMLLRQEYQHDRLLFIMGSDSFLKLHTWYRGLELLNVTNIAVMQRPGYASCTDLDFVAKLKQSAPEEFKLYQQKCCHENGIIAPNGHLYFIPNQMFDISSTKLRQMLKQRDYNKAKAYLNPEVLAYIKANNLYVGTNTEDMTNHG